MMLESYLAVGIKCIYWGGLNLMKDFISCDKSFPLDHQIYRMKCRFNESILSKYDITLVDIIEDTGNDFRILIKYRIIQEAKHQETSYLLDLVLLLYSFG